MKKHFLAAIVFLFSIITTTHASNTPWTVITVPSPPIITYSGTVVAVTHVTNTVQRMTVDRGNGVYFTIYARLTFANVVQNIDDGYYNVVMHFYSNEQCTLPLTVTNLAVNIEHILYVYDYDVNELWHSFTTSSYTCTGSVYTVLEQTENFRYYNGEDFEHYYRLKPGTGYVDK
jgi:hypothetical protein